MIVHTGQEEMITISLVVGAICGAATIGGWMHVRMGVLHARLGTYDAMRLRLETEAKNVVRERDELVERLRQSTTELAQLHGRRTAEVESVERERMVVRELRQELAAQFSQLSAEALNKNSDTFLQLARESMSGLTEAAKSDLALRQQAITETLRPVTDQMKLLEEHIAGLEQKRGVAYGELTQQVRGLLEAQGKLIESSSTLREETARLAGSLRSNSVRGRWGELQLRNVIELAGMAEHCDFYEQRTVLDGNGAPQRPDVTVRLPSGHCIAVDAKAPLTAYLDATEATTEEERKRCMNQHAMAIRTHCIALRRKAYWERFDQTPEFVILFLPGEMFYSAALQADHDLLNWSWEQNVILATPTMLIALLRTIAHGWRAAAIEQNALEVRKIGIDLHRSLSTMTKHIVTLARSIGGTVDAYNDFVGSFERNVFAKARRFSELKVVSEDIPGLSTIEKHPRNLSRDEGRLVQPETPPVLPIHDGV